MKPSNLESQINLDALDTEDPIAIRTDTWVQVFIVTSKQFRVPIRKFLGLKMPWNEHDGFSKEELQQVIDAACQRTEISEQEFWQAVKRNVRLQYEEAAAECEHRRWEIERTRLLATLPNEADLEPILITRRL